MSKTNIKRAIAPEQDNLCALTGVPIDPENAPELIDTDRVIERFKGGTYERENVRIVTPRAHMERHGNLRYRPEWLETLKAKMDSRNKTMTILLGANNQLLAEDRQTDHLEQSQIDFLQEVIPLAEKRLNKIGREIEKHLKASEDPLITAALGVPGLGAMSVAGLTVYVDLAKANSASSLWSYTGLHKASHERYTKGEAGGGNKTLRTILWNTANSMIKNRKCTYRNVYDRTKARLEVSEKITTTTTNQGKKIECMWKDTMPNHRHGAALRAIMKHLLADYWFVGRELAGLSTRPLYVQEQLGHTGIIQPEERGWIWK